MVATLVRPTIPPIVGPARLCVSFVWEHYRTPATDADLDRCPTAPRGSPEHLTTIVLTAEAFPPALLAKTRKQPRERGALVC